MSCVQNTFKSERMVASLLTNHACVSSTVYDAPCYKMTNSCTPVAPQIVFPPPTWFHSLHTTFLGIIVYLEAHACRSKYTVCFATRRPKHDMSVPTFDYEDAICQAKPIIQDICTASGTPGLAIRVFDQNGKIINYYHSNHNIKEQLKPNKDTVFNIGSIYKGFTALAIACLVADGKLHSVLGQSHQHFPK